MKSENLRNIFTTIRHKVKAYTTSHRNATTSVLAAAVVITALTLAIVIMLKSPALAPLLEVQSGNLLQPQSGAKSSDSDLTSKTTMPSNTNGITTAEVASLTLPDDTTSQSSSGHESTSMTTYSSKETSTTTRPDERPVDPLPTPSSTTVSPAQSTYFVSPDGSDQSGNGSRTSPYGTIQFAIETVPSFSVIHVMAGTYTERLDFSGRKDLTVLGEENGKTTLSGKIFSNGYLIEISQAHDIHLKNIIVSDFRGNDLECVLIRRGSSNIKITGCVFRDIGVLQSNGNAHVILAKGDRPEPLRNITIAGNTIYRCYTGSSESVTMESNVDGFEISRNLIYDVSNIAIDVTGFYANGVNNASLNQARNGRITNNTLINVVSGLDACAAIYIDGGRDILIENNHVSHSIYGIELGCENRFDEDQITVPAIVSGITVCHNTIHNCLKAGFIVGGYDMSTSGTVQNCDIYNNTLYKNNTEFELSRCSDIRFSRNIVFGSGGDRYYLYHYTESSVSGLRINDNIYFTDYGTGRFKYLGSYASDLKQWQQISGFDLDSRQLDPLFTAPDKADFRLRSGSEAIGYGA